MKSTWHIQDIIDLEYFLYLDEKHTAPIDLETLHLRDRSFFLEVIANDNHGRKASRPSILLKWLQFRRKNVSNTTDSFLPGQLTREVFQLLRLFFLGSGLLLGCGLGFSFFTYTGTAPLNVFHFLASFILSQLLLLFLLFVSSAIRARKKNILASSLLYSALAKTLVRLLLFSKKHLLNRMAAATRNAFESAVGLIQGKKRYGSLFYWPLFIKLQLFGIGFNIGLLAVTLLKVVTTDLAFGWQSTVQFSNEAIFTFVRVLALPWSWCLDHPFPSLAEIEGSRMILKDGIYSLTTHDLISWWPFLSCALLVYGLVPRIFLLITGLVRKKHSLATLPLDQASHDRLLQRMQTPHISTQAAPEEGTQQQDTTPRIRREGMDKPESPAFATSLVVMIPDDVYISCPDNVLKEILSQKGYTMAKKIRFGEAFETDHHIVQELAETHFNNTDGILVLMEAWMPPITDFTTFLRELREAVSPTTIIRIGLLGKPGPETIFTAVQKEHFTVWQQKINSLGDPYLRVEHLVSTS